MEQTIDLEKVEKINKLNECAEEIHLIAKLKGFCGKIVIKNNNFDSFVFSISDKNGKLSLSVKFPDTEIYGENEKPTASVEYSDFYNIIDNIKRNNKKNSWDEYDLERSIKKSGFSTENIDVAFSVLENVKNIF